MKCLKTILPAFALALCACNNNNAVPPAETVLPIAEQYLPCTVSFNINDTEWTDKIKEWADKDLIVNDVAELPDDPLGFSDAYKGVNFNESTLLITYDIHNWEIDTYRNLYYRNNMEQSYNWHLHVGTSTPPDSDAEQWYFTRYAILVKKLPEDADIKIWLGLGVLNWFPE